MEDLLEPSKDAKCDSGASKRQDSSCLSAREEGASEAAISEISTENNTVCDQNSGEQVNKNAEHESETIGIESDSCPDTGSGQDHPDSKEGGESPKAEVISTTPASTREESNLESCEEAQVTEGKEKNDASADTPMDEEEITNKGETVADSERNEDSACVQDDVSEGQTDNSRMDEDETMDKGDSVDHSGGGGTLDPSEDEQRSSDNLQDESVIAEAEESNQQDADESNKGDQEMDVDDCNTTKESYQDQNSVDHPESADGQGPEDISDDSSMDEDDPGENTLSPVPSTVEFVQVDSKEKENLEDESNGVQDEDSEDANNIDAQDPIGIGIEGNEDSSDQIKISDDANNIEEQNPIEANQEVGNEIKIGNSFSISSETNGVSENKDPLDALDESNNDAIVEDGESEAHIEAEGDKGTSNPDENSDGNVTVRKDLCATNDDAPKSNQETEKGQVDASEKDDSEPSKDDTDTPKEAGITANEGDTSEELDKETSDRSNDEVSSPVGRETGNETKDRSKDTDEPMEVEEISSATKNQTVEKGSEREGVESELEKSKSTEKEKESPQHQTDTENYSEKPTETITDDKIPTEGIDDCDEEICIIPDTVPRMQLTESGEKSSGNNVEVVKENSSQKTPSNSGKDARGKGESPKGRKKSLGEVTDRIWEKSVEQLKDGSDRRERPQRQAAKKAESQIKELAAAQSQTESMDKDSSLHTCSSCFRVRPSKYQIAGAGRMKYLCSEDCYKTFKKEANTQQSDPKSSGTIHLDPEASFTRKCAQCGALVNADEKNLSWETMDYCNEDCLGKFQRVLGSHCANCKGSVAQQSLGKYCVRFGYDVKQFCCSTCLEEYKKGLKVCSYCQKDISAGSDGFLAPVGDKGQFKDFCTQSCMEKYDQMSNQQPPPAVMHNCAVCNNEKVVKLEVLHNRTLNKLCSEPCFAAFKFVNGVVADQCFMCKKYYDKREVENFSVYSDESVHSFCNKTCMNVYILANRKIVPCQWCKVKKYNFDMIKRVLASGQVLLVCSLNCLTLYQVSISAISSKRVKCDMCAVVAQPQYHLTMSDATIRNFCNYQCVMQFQGQYTKSSPVPTESTPVPTGAPKRLLPRNSSSTQNENQVGAKISNSGAMPIISSVTSLAPNNQSPAQKSASITTRSAALKQMNNNVQQNQSKSGMMCKQQVVFRPPMPKAMKHKGTSCRPCGYTKGVSCRPYVINKETQTDENMGKPVLIPVPVPIYVPAPLHMYSTPFPVPVPFPLPVPVPLFIPTTRKSTAGILKEIKRIQEKIPTDPFEAELLMMAEMVAGEKKANASDSESEEGDNGAGDITEEPAAAAVRPASENSFSPEAVDSSNTFGEDMLQIALKMATELDEPTDLEAALTTSTITQQPAPRTEQSQNAEVEDDPEPVETRPVVRTRKRSARTTRSATASKRRRGSGSGEAPPALSPAETPPRARTPEQEKPDANMCLKYTFGVNAWKQWVLTKNAELEKAASSSRKLKLFKPEILQLTADELNYSLCLFVKEVRKPNGTEYAPDTIYYLCLGIQQYLFENGRIDNIFTDPYYEKFTECLDDIAKKFTALYNEAQFIVTRVEEEHLWESKQLGAHSPHVLLSTLMFFNTKHFNLTTVEDHMQLSFSHIMKHWKRYPGQTGAAGNKTPSGIPKNVLLRFYPPPAALEANSKKKKLYEQQENEENPLRCPVKLYEFYLSKCPESVKGRNDVFYLLPERSCVPDSPVWYSTMALGKEPLLKMLHRVNMVKEINVALLAT